MATFVALLHVLGWGVLAGVVAPGNVPAASTGAFGIGLGVATYTLDSVGYTVLALFVCTWILALGVWRFAIRTLSRAASANGQLMPRG